jgi:hypothetical protein
VSKSERFFNPKSLVRIARAVEWEPELEYDKSGSSNQAYYMEAMGLLWEHWLVGESFPEFVDLALAAGKEDIPKALQLLCQQFPGKLAQVVGWWKGVFGRRRVGSLFFPVGVNPWGEPGAEAPPPSSIEDRIFLVVDQLVTDLKQILAEEDEIGKGSDRHVR